MIYLIGGPPRCGKSTVACSLAQVTGACWFPADYIGSMIAGYIPDKDREMLWPSWGVSVDDRFRIFSSEEMVQRYRTRARTSRMALESFVEYAIYEGRDFVVEGYHVEPAWASQTVSAYGKDTIRSAFLYKLDEADIEAGITKGVGDSDWLASQAKKDQTYRKAAVMISHYSRCIRDEAAKYGLAHFRMDYEFQHQVRRVVAFMNR